MSKEEIALQLALSKLNCLQKTKSANDYKESEEFNLELGRQIATLYNKIYKNLDLNNSNNV